MSQRSGTVAVPEGSVFWKLAEPANPSKSRPVLLFLHSAITDHTAWDTELAHFSAQGWTCIVTERFGYGASTPSTAFLALEPRPPIDFDEHWAAVLHAALPADHVRKAIVIGLSMGGASAVQFAITRPDLVAGLVVVAGGVAGFECEIPDSEMKLLDEEERLEKDKDVEGLAQWTVKYWGDGPHSKSGRISSTLRDRMLAWKRDIAHREATSTGGYMPGKRPSSSLLERLQEIKVPTAVAWGTHDETSTNGAMKHIAHHIPGATLTEFPAAHLINLEVPDEFGRWMEAYLTKNFPAA